MPADGGTEGLEAAIFDIGGVLELTPPTGWQQRWADALGLPRKELERRLDPLWTPGELGHSSMEEIERATAERLDLDPQQLRSLCDDIWAEYLGSPNPELIAYFAALRPRLRTGILSNSLVGAREREQEAYDFEDLCDVVVYSHEEGMAKPDPRFYELACSRLDCDPSRTVFVDDRAICVEGAERVGLRAIHHVGNEGTIAELDDLLRSDDPAP